MERVNQLHAKLINNAEVVVAKRFQVVLISKRIAAATQETCFTKR